MTVANTYTEPTTGTALNTARSYFNDSMRAVLTNFKGPAIPTQLKADDNLIGEQDGMLYRSTVTNALYISDSVNKQTNNIGGGFTRWGIGHRVESTLAALTTNVGLYEKGEIVVTLDTGKLYVKNGAANSIASFTDVGASASTPKTFSIFNASGSFTVPSGITTIYVMVIGGGRGGSYGTAGTTYIAAVQGSYGTPGYAAFKSITTTPGTVYTFTVGAGGAAGATPGNGSNSIFNTTIIGGGGGTAVSSGGDVNNIPTGTMLNTVHQVLSGVKTTSLSLAEQIVLLNISLYRAQAASSTAAIAYTYGDPQYPGAGGAPSSSPGTSTNATGGVGGAVIIFY